MAETNPSNPSTDATDAWRNRSEVMGADRVGEALDLRGYALAEQIGAGGMGEVYHSSDPVLDRDLAVKVMKAGADADAGAEGRFLREARVTGSLQHPGIVPVYNLGRLADGRLHYTMKLVRGRTLKDLLRDSPAGPERVPRLLAVFEKVCQAVAYAHSRGVIHRDLKPSNVMVGEFGEVQVMDWGLAKRLGPLQDGPPGTSGETQEGTLLGTPAYMPPEQAAGQVADVDRRSGLGSRHARASATSSASAPQVSSRAKASSRSPRADRRRISSGVGRSNGGLPVRTSHSTAPRPKTSARASRRPVSARACSGAMYTSVPKTTPACERSAASDCTVQTTPGESAPGGVSRG